MQATAAERGLLFENRVDPEAVLETDGEKLHLILSNVLSNAVAYSQRGATIGCSFGSRSGRIALTVSNHARDLDIDDLPDMFDRFWRKDSVRRGGHHLGLGLTIVRSLAELLGFEIETVLAGDGLFELTFRGSA